MAGVMFTKADMSVFKYGAPRQWHLATAFKGLEPDRLPAILRAAAMLYVAMVYLTGRSNYDAFPKFYKPFIDLGITEPHLAHMCLAFGGVGLIGGFLPGLYGWLGRMVGAVWSAAFWTTACLGLVEGAGTEIIATAAYAYIAAVSWRHTITGGRS